MNGVPTVVMEVGVFNETEEELLAVGSEWLELKYVTTKQIMLDGPMRLALAPNAPFVQLQIHKLCVVVQLGLAKSSTVLFVYWHTLMQASRMFPSSSFLLQRSQACMTNATSICCRS